MQGTIEKEDSEKMARKKNKKKQKETLVCDLDTSLMAKGHILSFLLPFFPLYSSGSHDSMLHILLILYTVGRKCVKRKIAV